MSGSLVSEAIPAELRRRKQWLCWRYEQRQGKPTKTPIDAHTGHLAKTNDPRTWSSHDEARAAVDRFGCDGVGFVFAADDPYVGIDLDHCRDPQSGAILPTAQRIIAAFATYAEISVSGNGVHLICRGQIPDGSRHRGRLDGLEVEIYDRTRYFVMTGQPLVPGDG